MRKGPGIMEKQAVDPVQLAARVRRRLAIMYMARQWIRRARGVLVVGLVLVVIYAWLSYSFYTVPGAWDPGARTAQFPIHDIRPADALMLQNLNLWRTPRLDDVVIYRNPGAGDGAPESLIGRIAGLPGETVRRRGPTVAVEGREPLPVGFDFGPGQSVRDGDVIPEASYLVLADIDSLPYPDSRALGYIGRQDIDKRVALNLSAAFGEARAP